MVSIWAMVGLVLCVYGAIVAGCGVAYLFGKPAATALGHLNPCLWWGTIMLAFGALLLALPRLYRRRRRGGDGRGACAAD
jgi:membrane protein implicated in regulation of membrane protease activity